MPNPAWKLATTCLLTAGLLGACSPKLSLPPDALIDCASGQACPGNLVCKASIGRCVDPSQENQNPPSIVAPATVTPPQGKAGTTFSTQFDVSGPLAQAPEVVVTIKDQTFPAVLDAAHSSGQHYVFQYTATGAEPEGQADFLASIVDTSGNPAKGLPAGRFVVDFTPPKIGFAAVQYIPADGNPLGSGITAATGGTTVRVLVNADETLSDAGVPAMTATNGQDTIPFTLVPGSLSDRGATFEAVVPNGASDSPRQYLPSISGWKDVAGNATVASFSSPSIQVQTTQPGLVIQQGQVEYLRSPWGNATAEGADGGFTIPVGPYFAIAPSDSLSGATTLPADTFQFSGGASPVQLRYWSSAQFDNLLGDAVPLAGGAWPRTKLAALDLLSIYVTGIDEAGNESAPVKLDNAEWVATPRKPSVGLSPHVAETTRLAIDSLWQPPTETTLAIGNELAGIDSTALSSRTEASWSLRVPSTTNPDGRSYFGMAYDSARNRVVVFGGLTDGVGVTQDTWEWDGETWVNRTPTGLKPSKRSNFAMVYDSARGRVLLFGGADVNAQPLGDTWEWDGTSWVEVTPASGSPTPRNDYAMAYDSARGRVVLFGGYASGFSQETWEWDGAAWNQVFPFGQSPDPRFFSAMAYDAARQKMVLFGGFGGSGQDTWEYDGTSWSNVTPAGASPDPRTEHAMIYDSARQKVVLFGGRSSGNFVADSWEWNGTDWAPVTPSGKSPAARAEHAMVYDSALHRAVLFGGYDFARDNDTWVWDGTAWTEKTHKTANTPDARSEQGMAYDEARQNVVIFGGWGASSGATGPLGDTWTWDGTNWVDAGTLTPAPRARWHHGMAYDRERQVVVLFGGLDDSTPVALLKQDTWIWDGGSWADVTPTGSKPSPREQFAMAYDSARKQVVLFGGYDFSYRQDTWVWDGAAWTDVTPSGSKPSTRQYPVMAFDEARGRMVLFGGLDGTRAILQQDTWEWDGASWVDKTPTGTNPAPRQGGGLAYDRTRQRVVLFGGVAANNTPLNDLWEWDGTSWSDHTPAGLKPLARTFFPMVYDPLRERVVVFGGIDFNNNPQGDVWELENRSDRQPAIQFVTSGLLPGIGPISGLRVRARCGGASDPFTSAQDGAALFGWANGFGSSSPAGWRQLAANDAGVQAATDPGAMIDWSSGSLTEAQGLFLSRDAQAAFQCRPLGASGVSTQEASVAMDYIEERVRYLAP
jgi:hypothetical protein